jgi:hypothetical protein
MRKLTKEQRKKIIQAFRILGKKGFRIYVPGCFDIVNVDDLLLFSESPERFYAVRRG